MAYSVRNVKQFRGREGHGFNATLYRDNVKVALVMDAANGGEYRFEWVDYHTLPKQDVVWATYQGNLCTLRCTPEEAKLYEFIRGKTCEFPISETEVHAMAIDPDIFVSELVENYQNEKRFARLCKTNTLIRLVGDKEGAWIKFPVPFTQSLKNLLVAKYGDQLEEIMNETRGQVAS